VYKDNGNKKKAIEIYKIKIFSKNNDEKWNLKKKRYKNNLV
jgi:hypothetical protein